MSTHRCTGACSSPCEYLEVPEEAVPTYFRFGVDGFWSITKNPGIDATNLVSNPSVELNLDGWGSDNGDTLTRVSPGYRGTFAMNVAGGGTLIDVTFASLQFFVSPFPQIDIPPGETYFANVAIRGCPGDTITARLIIDGIFGGAPLVENSVTMATNGLWQVFNFSSRNPNAIPAPARIYISSDNGSGCNEFQVDGATISTLDISIFDGDSLFAGWNGPVHASTSTARAGTRGWGETINLSNYNFQLITDEGFGYPPVQLVTSNFARRAGSSYQRMQVLPRVITLTGRIESADPIEIHRLRHELIRDIGIWDVTDCGQEFLLKFQYTNNCGDHLCEELEIPVEYSGGLEALRTNMTYEQIILQFVANEFPFWRNQNNDGRVLQPGGTVTFTYNGTAPAPVGLRFRGPMTLNSITNDTNNTTITFGVPGPGIVIPAGQYAVVYTQPGQVFAALFVEATGAAVGPLPINYANSQPGRFRLSPNGAQRQTITLDAIGGESSLTWFDTWLSADSAMRECSA